MESPKWQGLRSFQVGHRIHILGGWHTPNSTGTEAPLLRTHPLYLFIRLFICILYKIPIIIGARKWSVSEFCEPLQQIIEPEKGAVETPRSQLVGGSTEGLGLALGTWRGEQSHETEPLSCGVCTNATKLSVRIKINCRTPTCCLESCRIGCCGVKKNYTSGVRSGVGKQFKTDVRGAVSKSTQTSASSFCSSFQHLCK